MQILKTVSALSLVALIAAAPAFALAKNNDSYKPRATGSTLEVAIADSGKTVVRGARVTGVSDSTITAQTIWGASSITWTVRTDSSTEFLNKSGRATGDHDVAVGDYLSFSGMLTGGSSFAVDADVVKNWSAEDKRVALVGVVIGIDNDSFTLQTVAHGTVTVEVDGDTDFSGSLGALADIDMSARVVAYGSYDADAKVLVASDIAAHAHAGKKVRAGWDNFVKGFGKFEFWKK